MDYHDCDHQVTNAVHSAYTPAAIKPNLVKNEKIKLQAAQSMDQLTGWCTKFKAFKLIDLVIEKKASIVVEIGVWGGKSLVPMAYALKSQGYGKVYGIDPWSSNASIEGMDGVNKDWWSAVDHDAIYNGIVEKINQFQLTDFIELIKSTSVNVEPILNIDIFI